MTRIRLEDGAPKTAKLHNFNICANGYLLITSKQGLVSISMLVPDLRIIAEQWDKAAVLIQGQKTLPKIGML